MPYLKTRRFIGDTRPTTPTLRGRPSPGPLKDLSLKVMTVTMSSPKNHQKNSKCITTTYLEPILFLFKFLRCTSPGDADSCQMLSRKKRRGVIEKKRRDRINMSLSELKRLVPSAFEKQGSAKLEKAEILQMTVDHLKMIHAKGKQVANNVTISLVRCFVNELVVLVVTPWQVNKGLVVAWEHVVKQLSFHRIL